MSKPIRIEIDGITNTATAIELSPEEIAEREQMRLEAEAEQAARDAEAIAKAEAKASGIAKLMTLGLTESEATALLN